MPSNNNNQEQKTVILKPNWDYEWTDPIETTDEHEPIFIGRDNELKKIKHFITQQKEGVLAISGQRGSGKTATVNKAISGIQDEDRPHIVRIQSLVFENDSKDLPLQLLSQIINALYAKYGKRSWFKRINIKNIGKTDWHNDLIGLYNDVNATRFFQRNEESVLKSAQIGLSFNIPIREILKNFILPAYLITIASLSIKGLEFLTSWFGWVSLVFGIVSIVLTISYSFNRETNFKKVVEIEGITHNDIQRRLTGILRAIDKEEQGLLIIFDELDYYDDDQNSAIKPEKLLDAIKSVKLLLHTSGAAFIFIIGTNTFKLFETKDKFSTIPSEKLYLPAVSPEDLYSFFKASLKPEQLPIPLDIEDFVYLLIYRSGNNFYKFKQEVKDRLSLDKTDIMLKVSKLSKQDHIEANLIKAAHYIHKYYIQSEITNYIHDSLIKVIYEVIENYVKYLPDQSVTSFNLEDARSDADAVVAQYKKDILNAYLRAIYAQINRTPSLDNKTIDIDWSAFWSLSDSSVISRDIKGAVFDDEKELVNKHKGLVKRIKDWSKLLGSNFVDGVDNVEKLYTEFAKRLVIDMVDIDTKPLDVLWEIDNKLLNERVDDKWQQKVKNAYDDLQLINNQLSKDILIGNDLVFVRRMGQASLGSNDQNSLDFKLKGSEDSAQFVSLVTFFHNLMPTVVSITGKLIKLNGAIFNILVGLKEWDPNNFTNNKFLMFRVDGRNETDYMGDGVLLKEEGKNEWGYIEGLPKLNKKVARMDIKLSFVCEGGRITFEVSGKNVVRDYLVGGQGIFWLGFANELHDVNFNDVMIDS